MAITKLNASSFLNHFFFKIKLSLTQAHTFFTSLSKNYTSDHAALVLVELTIPLNHKSTSLMKHLNTIILIILPFLGFSQNFEQTIRGTVKDADTKQPLIGAAIAVLNSTYGAVTDIDGNFKIENVPVGRISLQASYISYEPMVISNIELSTAKELVLSIELTEKVYKGDEIVVTAKPQKSKPNNEVATVSVRQFTIEESQRFAGARNDVSRMAANFAGVQASNDQANDIVIRGNSPNTLLWRLEGVDIPNPNHFGDYGSTGGPVSMLNNNVLANSDFLTGAFPAGYGNTISGVFDLQMRKGNNQKHEFLGQVGFNGFELGAEGPLSKNGASYLINARYSTLEFMQNLGMDFGTGTAVPKYKDLTFKVFMPLTKKANISVFGIGGMSSIDFINSELDSTEQGDLWSQSTLDIYDRTKMGVVGLSYNQLIGSKAYLKSSIAFTTQSNTDIVDSVAPASHQVYEFYNQDFHNKTITAHTYYNHKLNNRNALRLGLIVNHKIFSIKDSIFRNNTDEYLTLTNSKGNTDLTQLYFNFNHKFTDALQVNLGFNHQWLWLNNQQQIEPRVGLKYDVAENTSLNLGYGLHSYMAPLNFYFIEERQADGSYEKPNTDLDFIKSHHFVVGVNHSFNRGFNLKVETYYQNIFSSIVGTPTYPTFSMINMASFDFAAPDSLQNGGSGVNYGLELTLEKYLNKGFYMLATASVFESKYKPLDGKTYNTKFNNNYVVNLVGGKEWQLPTKEGSKFKSSIALDIKATVAGGQRYTPIDLDASILAGEAVYDYDQPYSLQFDNYKRFDVRIAYKMTGKKIVQEWAFDVQNLTDEKNALLQRYNASTKRVDVSNQLGRFPMMQYRIQF